jgi:hypothetical protein
MRTSQKSKVRSPELNRLSVIFILFGIMLGSCNSEVKKAEPAKQFDESGFAEFGFSEELHNFGSLNAGELVSFTFIFRNIGTKTLIISKVDTGCGCTKVNIQEKTIAPGEEGQIEVIYDSAGEVGKALKTITIYSNAKQEQKQIFIRANVTNELIKIYS